MIDQRDALLVIQIDQNFERQLAGRARRASVQVIADGRNSNTAGTALGYVNAIVAASTPTGAQTHGQAGAAAAGHDAAPGTTPTSRRAGT